MSKTHNDSALVIFSGGQDSTTCLIWAKKYFSKVFAVTFLYGQNHDIEVEASKEICKILDVPQTIVNIDLGQVAESNLLNKGDVNSLNEKNLPSSFVPNRNQTFITLSHALAQKLGVNNLVTGVCETDYSGYPDCRQEFIDSVERTSNLGSNSSIKIHTPLMYLDKASTWKLANDLGGLDLIINHSITCYNGKKRKNVWGYGCGECPSCELRKRGYYKFSEERSAI